MQQRQYEPPTIRATQLNWRDPYFEEGYLRRWRLPPSGPCEWTEAQAILELLDARQGSRILDIGCGHGRYAVALARVGAAVVRLDGSMALLERARSHSVADPNQPLWIRGDMRRLPFRRSFDVALAVDAFGYFDAEREGVELLRAIHGILRQGGRLLMRNPNGAFIRSHFRASEEERRGSCRVSIRNVLDETGRWLDQHIVIADAQGVAEYGRRQRIYAAQELDVLLASAGFSTVEHYADWSGTPFDEEASPRLITASNGHRIRRAVQVYGSCKACGAGYFTFTRRVLSAACRPGALEGCSS